MDNLILKMIAFYQRVISPRKGYRCAYSVLHQTHGCSGAVKEIIQRKGAVGGWQEIRQRFADCRLAAETLQQEPVGAPGRKQRRKREEECDSCNASGCDNRGCSDAMPDLSPDLDCSCDCSSLSLRRNQQIKKSPP